MFKEIYSITKSNEMPFVLNESYPKLNLNSGIYNSGILTLFDKSYSGKIDLSNWSDILGRESFICIGSTALGDLFLYNPKTKDISLFETQRVILTNIEIGINVFLNEFLISKKIVSSVLNKEYTSTIYEGLHQELKYGQCYILTPYLVLGGSDIPENYKIGDISIYLELLNQSR